VVVQLEVPLQARVVQASLVQVIFVPAHVPAEQCSTYGHSF
jgi:hypothetical protein